MSNLLPGLLVLAIGGSIARPLLLLTILFLGSRRPLPNAGVLALGYFATCAVIGISGLVLFGDAEGAVSTVGRVISITVGGLLIASSLGPEGSIVVLGFVLLVFAIPVVVLIGLLYGRAATCAGGAGVIADVDGEAQPGDHSRDLLRVRSVLPHKRPACGVRA